MPFSPQLEPAFDGDTLAALQSCISPLEIHIQQAKSGLVERDDWITEEGLIFLSRLRPLLDHPKEVDPEVDSLYMVQGLTWLAIENQKLLYDDRPRQKYTAGDLECFRVLVQTANNICISEFSDFPEIFLYTATIFSPWASKLFLMEEFYEQLARDPFGLKKVVTALLAQHVADPLGTLRVYRAQLPDSLETLVQVMHVLEDMKMVMEERSCSSVTLAKRRCSSLNWRHY